MYRKDDLLRDLAKMELNPQGTVLIHSSMRSIGEVEGRGDTVLDAFCEYFRSGLLIFPTHTWNKVGENYPVFDSRTEPACVGILPNLFLKRPGVIRSLHPTHSVAALGKDAEEYTAGEQYRNTPCPRNGCWGKLIDRDAQILFLGCSLRSNTFIHGVEEWNQIPDRISDWTQHLTIIGAKGEEYHTEMHRHHCKACDAVSDDVSNHYDKVEDVFRKLGAIRYGTFGNARCIIGNARKMNEITSMLLKKDPNLFVDTKAIPESWY